MAQATRDLHAAAEGSGVVAQMLRGSITRAGYVLYLRNLLPAYLALESGLVRHRDSLLIGPICLAETFRVAPLQADLAAIAGPGWADLAVLPEAASYAAAIDAAGDGDGALLLAHAYTRVLGDLSGGQMLARVMAGLFGLGPLSLQFYRFPEIADLAGFKAGYRARLDESGAMLACTARVIDAARSAFEHNIALSEAVAGAVAVCEREME